MLDQPPRVRLRDLTVDDWRDSDRYAILENEWPTPTGDHSAG